VLDKGDGDKRIYSEGVSRTLDGRIRYTGTHAYSASASGTVTLGVWQHVVMTWSRTTGVTRLYYNGVEVPYAVHDVGSGSPVDDSAPSVRYRSPRRLGRGYILQRSDG